MSFCVAKTLLVVEEKIGKSDCTDSITPSILQYAILFSDALYTYTTPKMTTLLFHKVHQYREISLEFRICFS